MQAPQPLHPSVYGTGAVPGVWLLGVKLPGLADMCFHFSSGMAGSHGSSTELFQVPTSTILHSLQQGVSRWLRILINTGCHLVLL